MADSLGRRIADARIHAGLNRNQLARALGTSWQHVDHWEKGRTQPSLESLRRIAEVLGVSVDHLLGLRRDAGSASALERFLSELAPADLTAEEEEWLRTAPLPPGAAPQHYLRLLRSVRGLPAPPKSGTRAKVDRASLAEAVKRGRGTP